jgi:hypothetical protein
MQKWGGWGGKRQSSDDKVTCLETQLPVVISWYLDQRGAGVFLWCPPKDTVNTVGQAPLHSKENRPIKCFKKQLLTLGKAREPVKQSIDPCQRQHAKPSSWPMSRRQRYRLQVNVDNRHLACSGRLMHEPVRGVIHAT